MFQVFSAKKSSSPRRKQRGISLPMMAIFLGVGGLVTYVAVVYGPRYFVKAKVSNEIAALGDFKSNTVALGSRVGLFTGTNASASALVSQNFWPASMVSGTQAAPVITNQWGGSVTVAVGTINVAGDALVRTDTAIPATACTELATSLDTVASVISVNGTQVKANGAATNPTTVGTSCGGANGDNNTLVVTFAK